MKIGCTIPAGGFVSMLTILFIGLKLTHYIDWSWWLILSPLWLPIVLVVVAFLLVFAFYLIVDGRDYRWWLRSL